MMNLRKSTVLAAAVLLLLLCLGTVRLVQVSWPSWKRRPAAVATVSPRGVTAPTSFLDRFPAEYPTVKKAEAALPPKGVPVPPSTVADALQHTTPTPPVPATPTVPAQPQVTVADLQVMIDRAVAKGLAQQAAQQPPMSWEEIALMMQQAALQARAAQGPATPPPGATPTATPEGPKKTKWAYLAEGQTPKDAPKEQGEGPRENTKSTAQDLTNPARWAIPINPLKTIYRSMRMTGRLLDNINSDIPAQTIRIALTEDLVDKFRYHTVILPADSIVIAQQVGKAEFGQARIPLTIEQIEPPTGEVIGVEGAIGDEHGAAGVPGKVNAHIPSLVLAAGINALMYLGLNTAAGTPGAGHYYQDPAQSAAQQAGQAISQDVNSYTRQVLKRPPTIEVDAEKKPKIVTITGLGRFSGSRSSTGV
jgi:type IV secretory pathway VirB10-like protein